MPCRPIDCPTSELYRYDGIPLRRDVDHSISIDIGQLHWQILMKKHHFDIVSIKATLCWTDISADIKWYKYYPIPLRTRYRPVDVRNRTSTPEVLLVVVIILIWMDTQPWYFHFSNLKHFLKLNGFGQVFWQLNYVICYLYCSYMWEGVVYLIPVLFTQTCFPQ